MDRVMVASPGSALDIRLLLDALWSLPQYAMGPCYRLTGWYTWLAGGLIALTSLFGVFQKPTPERNRAVADLRLAEQARVCTLFRPSQAQHRTEALALTAACRPGASRVSP
jgi:hypothetical protein